MRIVIITQEEPFYLSENIEYLIDKKLSNYNVSGCVIGDPSPFGKKESFLKKASKTLRVFGFKFFIYYTFKLILRKLTRPGINKIIKKRNIPIIKIKGSINSKKSLEMISKFSPELLISILGNQIFKKPLLDLARFGCINLHTGLLPKYRGLMPTFWAMKNKEKFIGISVFFVDEGIDSGPIIIQQKIKIGNQSLEKLIKITKLIGMDLIAQSVDLIKKNKFILIKNPDNEMTYYSFPKRTDVIEFLNDGNRFF